MQLKSDIEQCVWECTRKGSDPETLSKTRGLIGLSIFLLSVVEKRPDVHIFNTAMYNNVRLFLFHA